MIYSFNDFKIIKDKKLGNCCGAGLFGDEIYALLFYREGGCGSAFWMEIYRITKKEFDLYPRNAFALSSRFDEYRGELLCSDYNGKGGRAYSFEVKDGKICIL